MFLRLNEAHSDLLMPCVVVLIAVVALALTVYAVRCRRVAKPRNVVPLPRRQLEYYDKSVLESMGQSELIRLIQELKDEYDDLSQGRDDAWTTPVADNQRDQRMSDVHSVVRNSLTVLTNRTAKGKGVNATLPLGPPSNLTAPQLTLCKGDGESDTIADATAKFKRQKMRVV